MPVFGGSAAEIFHWCPQSTQSYWQRASTFASWPKHFQYFQFCEFCCTISWVLQVRGNARVLQFSWCSFSIKIAAPTLRNFVDSQFCWCDSHPNSQNVALAAPGSKVRWPAAAEMGRSSQRAPWAWQDCAQQPQFLSELAKMPARGSTRPGCAPWKSTIGKGFQWTLSPPPVGCR